MRNYWYKSMVVVLLIPILAGLAIAPALEQKSNVSLAPGLQLTRSDSQGLEFNFDLPEYELVQATVAGKTCDLLQVSGLFLERTPGYPQLPAEGVMVGMPAFADVSTDIQLGEMKTLTGVDNLCPGAEPYAEFDELGNVVSFGQRWARDEAVYASDQAFPAQMVEFETVGFIRSQNVGVLRIRPVQYYPETGELRLATRLKIVVTFNGQVNSSAARPGSPGESGYFEALLQENLVNYEQAREWRTQPAVPETGAGLNVQSTAASASDPTFKVQVSRDGLYQLTYQNLQDAGVAVNTLDPRTLKISYMGNEIDILVAGEGDGVFNSTDYVLFYGRKARSRFTDTNVYWLTWSGANGRRMATDNGTPGGTNEILTRFNTTLHLEQDKIYRNLETSGASADHWYWEGIQATSTKVTKNFPFTLANVSTETGTARIRGLLRGMSANPNHRTQVLLNGNLLEDVTWPSGSEYQFEISVPQASILEGSNTISIAGVEGYNQTFLINWIEIDYYDTYKAESDLLAFEGDAGGAWTFQVSEFMTDTLQVYNITDPLKPVMVENALITESSGKYTLEFDQVISGENLYLGLSPAKWLKDAVIAQDTPSNLRATSNQADWIIISHGDFTAQANELAQYRSSQGLTVFSANIQDVYDEFNGGVIDPKAIHDFLAYAYSSWGAPAPSYVVLLGDGHYDFKNFLATNNPVYIPPYLADIDPWYGETAADNRFVTVSGEDLLPDIHLGRLPARTAAEAQAMVNKIKSYDANLPSDGWNTKALFVADNPDNGGDFYTLSDNIIAQLPGDYTADKVYYGLNYTDAALAKQAIKNAVNQGRLLVSYIGHANSGAWAAEKIYEISDISTFTNSDRLTFMAPMTCFDGLYINPRTTVQSIGESVVREAGKGAIASFSPTGQGVAAGHDYLESGLFEALFENALSRLGPATTYAKLFLLTNTTGHRELLDTYILFGDPATSLHLVEKETTPTPTLTSTATSTGTATSTATRTPTVTSTLTATSTATGTATSTATSTLTQTPTSTSTATETPTPTGTSSPTPTETGTPPSTATDTPTPTETSTATATNTATSTVTATSTLTQTATSTLAATNTSTATLTPTATATLQPAKRYLYLPRLYQKRP